MKFKICLVRLVEKIKITTGLYTYQIEFLFVGIILLAVVLITRGKPIELIGSTAVFFSFAHAKVANRLAERESQRLGENPESTKTLSYYFKVHRYLVLKELFWIIYFITLGAYSALVGSIIFLLYDPWRTLWRTAHPLSEKLQ